MSHQETEEVLGNQSQMGGEGLAFPCVLPSLISSLILLPHGLWLSVYCVHGSVLGAKGK